MIYVVIVVFRDGNSYDDEVSCGGDITCRLCSFSVGQCGQLRQRLRRRL